MSLLNCAIPNDSESIKSCTENVSVSYKDEKETTSALLEDGETEILDEEPRSILLGLISQLRKGSDLARVTLPTFVLEPRSMCERITDFFSHPEFITKTSQKTDPLDRFIDILRFYLSGWHIRPKGVKKPYNPVLGEFFRCQWTLPDGAKAIYVSEQVSHHPPASAYMYACPEHDIILEGDIRPKSKFLGNSAATIMQGSTRINFMNLPGETYIITFPNMYARGILFGSMFIELGDSCTVRCESTDLVCEVDFKTKGFFLGKNHTVSGRVRRESTGEVLANLSGTWTNAMNLQYTEASGSSIVREKPIVLFDAETLDVLPKQVAPEEAQEPFESRRLWSKVSKGLQTRNIDQATYEKTALEENQRELLKQREAAGITWKPRFFTSDDDKWLLDVPRPLPTGFDECYSLLRKKIFSGPPEDVYKEFWLPR
ncbi:hypothetical protein HDV05_007004 [Chytridiales sp. JEL 0842]|nr:hypothetical protein HDV05_007004 [Chytridiales sp. JEL 0842]